VSPDDAAFVLPMFPLGSVLLPTAVLPLHVFEPRYRRLMADVGRQGRFGVAMIERGSEVGGGDARADVACIAQILRAEELPDGRWHVVAVGTGRVEVVRWLPDDPYPRAEVRALPEHSAADPDDGSWPALELAFRDLLQRLADRGAPVDPGVGLDPDPAVATYQMGALGPFEVLDRYRLLAAAVPADRRDLLVDLIAGANELLDL